MSAGHPGQLSADHLAAVRAADPLMRATRRLRDALGGGRRGLAPRAGLKGPPEPSMTAEEQITAGGWDGSVVRAKEALTARAALRGGLT